MQMIWTVYITAWTERKAQNSARKITVWLTEKFEHELDQYSLEKSVYTTVNETIIESRFTLNFTLQPKATAWNDAVVELIELGQRVGKMWTLSGDVQSDLVGQTSFPRVVGVAELVYRLTDSPLSKSS